MRLRARHNERMQDAATAVLRVIGVIAAVVGAGALLVRFAAGDTVFLAHPLVVLPLAVGACVSAWASRRVTAGATELGAIAASLGVLLACGALALSTHAPVAVALVPALRIPILAALALACWSIVPRPRALVWVAPALGVLAVTGAVMILLFQPADTPFGKFPALVSTTGATATIGQLVGFAVVQTATLSPLLVAVLAWVVALAPPADRESARIPTPARRDARRAAVIATVPVAIVGISVLLLSWRGGDASTAASVAYAVVGTASAIVAIELGRSGEAVPRPAAAGAVLSVGALVVAASGALSLTVFGGGGGAAPALLASTTAVVALCGLGVVAWAMWSRKGRASDETATPPESVAEHRPQPTAGLPGLTTREREILALVSDGLTNREVAARLHLSPRTVDAHLRSVFRKLGVAGDSNPRVRAALAWRSRV